MAEFNEEGNNFDPFVIRTNAEPTGNDPVVPSPVAEFAADADNEIAARKKSKRVATAFTAAMVSITGLLLLGTGTAATVTEPSVKMEALSLSATESEICYEVTLSDAPSDVYIAIFNDHMFKQAKLTDAICAGKIGGLQAGHTYTLELRETNDTGYSVIASRRVRTRGDP